jgi:ParB/RepB/Spo0J family partition protein
MPKLDPKHKELRGRVFMVDPRELVIDLEHNARRYTPQDVDNLACSMMDHGQLQDVMVRRTDDGRLTVVAGNLRAQAGVRLSTSDGPTPAEPFLLRCYLMDADDAVAFERAIVENWQRTDPSIIDTAHNLRRLMDLSGKSQRHMAGLYHRSEGWVSQTLSLLTLPAQAQKAIHDGEVSAEAAYMLSSKASPPQLNAFMQWMQGCRHGGDSRSIGLEDMRRFLHLGYVYREAPVPGDTTVEPAAPEPKQSSRELREVSATAPAGKLQALKIPEAKDQELKTIPLTRKEIARFWEELAKDVPEGQKPKPINQFAQVVVKWMAGTKGYGERKMKSVLEDVRYFGKG